MSEPRGPKVGDIWQYNNPHIRSGNDQYLIKEVEDNRIGLVLVRTGEPPAGGYWYTFGTFRGVRENWVLVDAADRSFCAECEVEFYSDVHDYLCETCRA